MQSPNVALQSQLRRSASLPVGATRSKVVDFTTAIMPVPADAAVLRRRVPRLALKLADRDDSERRAVSLVVERSNRHRRHVITHTVTIEAWLLSVLLFFSLVSASSGFALPGGSSVLAARGALGGLHASPAARASAVRMESAALAAQPVDPVLAAAVNFLSWNANNEESSAEFAAEVRRRKAVASEARAAQARAPKSRKVESAAELALELSKPSERPTVVVFGAKQCRTCRQVQPKLERAAAKAGASFLHMHYGAKTDELYREHGITHTPTVHVYDRAGELVSSDVYKLADVPKLARVLADLQEAGVAAA